MSIVVEPGDEYGRLTVIEELPRECSGNRKFRRIRCSCKCGNITEARLSNLRSGAVVSCGCAHIKYENGEYKSPTYKSWDMMKQRCLNPNDPSSHNYSERGITVCDRWLVFENFLADMGERPSLDHSIDRYPDKNGPYELGNCRWATRPEQSRNMRSNVVLEFDGESLCIAEWAERTGITSETLRGRIRLGWSVEDVLTVPVGTRRETL